MEPKRKEIFHDISKHIKNKDFLNLIKKYSDIYPNNNPITYSQYPNSIFSLFDIASTPEGVNYWTVLIDMFDGDAYKRYEYIYEWKHISTFFADSPGYFRNFLLKNIKDMPNYDTFYAVDLVTAVYLAVDLGKLYFENALPYVAHLFHFIERYGRMPNDFDAL